MSLTVVRTPLLTETSRQVLAANLARARAQRVHSLLGVAETRISHSLASLAAGTLPMNDAPDVAALLRAHVTVLSEQASAANLEERAAHLVAQLDELTATSADAGLDAVAAAARAAMALQQEIEAAAAAQHARQLATTAAIEALRSIGMRVEVETYAGGAVKIAGEMVTGETATVVVDEEAVVEATIADPTDIVPATHPAAGQECVRAAELAAAFDVSLRDALGAGRGDAGPTEIVEEATRGVAPKRTRRSRAARRHARSIRRQRGTS